MTLAEYIFTYGHVPMAIVRSHTPMNVLEYGNNGIVLMDIGAMCRQSAVHVNDLLWELHHLSDYAVSSSQGGWLYRLVPRKEGK